MTFKEIKRKKKSKNRILFHLPTPPPPRNRSLLPKHISSLLHLSLCEVRATRMPADSSSGSNNNKNIVVQPIQSNDSSHNLHSVLLCDVTTANVYSFDVSLTFISKPSALKWNKNFNFL